MVWDGSQRKSQLPADWQRRRHRTLRRDGYACQWRTDGVRCGKPASDVDHIVPGSDHSDSNLQSLCSWHHDRKSSAEGAAARKPRRSMYRQAETHPADM